MIHTRTHTSTHSTTTHTNTHTHTHTHTYTPSGNSSPRSHSRSAAGPHWTHRASASTTPHRTGRCLDCKTSSGQSHQHIRSSAHHQLINPSAHQHISSLAHHQLINTSAHQLISSSSAHQLVISSSSARHQLTQELGMVQVHVHKDAISSSRRQLSGHRVIESSGQ